MEKKMISAKEARDLYEQTNLNIEKYLAKDIEPFIVKAIEHGKCQCFILVASAPCYMNITPNTFHRAVMEELKKLNYTVKFRSYGDKYIPSGIADDYSGNGQNYLNHGFEISW